MKLPKIFNFIIPLIIGIALGIAAIALLASPKFLTPFISSPEISATRIESEKPIIAFLPYWNVNDVQIQYHLIDYLAYFALDLDYDGTIKELDNHNMEMGWYYLSQGKVDDIFAKAEKNEVKKMIVFTAFYNDLIDTITTNPDTKTQAIKSITEIVEDYDLDAINLDFEYNLGEEVSVNSGTNYATFISDLKKEIPDIEISICTYANGIIKDFPYKIKELSEVSDQVILMAYDFHRPNSTIAGPVAPIKSDTGVSINQAIDSAITKQVDLDKIILAMPFYGYEWQTSTQEFGSTTYPDTGAMASYKRVHTLIKERQLIADWNVNSMSPYLVYNDDLGRIKQIYYENDRSIGLKLEFVDQIGLGGAGIWAIGYEGHDASVWYTIQDWRKGE